MILKTLVIGFLSTPEEYWLCQIYQNNLFIRKNYNFLNLNLDEYVREMNSTQNLLEATLVKYIWEMFPVSRESMFLLLPG